MLTWEQLWSILGKASRRDRLLLALDMTEALRPSELFALRWCSFDDYNTLSITETVYRRKLRPYGKTPGSMTKVHLPDGLATELRQWKLECPDSSADAFIFPNADGGFLDVANYRFRVLKPLAEELEIEKLNFQILRRTMATQAQSMGSVKDIQAHLRHSAARYYGARVHAGAAGKCADNGRIRVRNADERRGRKNAVCEFATKCHKNFRGRPRN